MALVPSLHFSLFFRKKSINNCKNFPRLFSSIFSCVKEGTPETSQYKVFVTKNDKISSFWHSVPLFADQNNGLYNYVNEIPKGTRAKMEIATKIENNPIVQDVKKVCDFENLFCMIGKFEVFYVWRYSVQLWMFTSNLGRSP